MYSFCSDRPDFARIMKENPFADYVRVETRTSKIWLLPQRVFDMGGFKKNELENWFYDQGLRVLIGPARAVMSCGDLVLDTFGDKEGNSISALWAGTDPANVERLLKRLARICRSKNVRRITVTSHVPECCPFCGYRSDVEVASEFCPGCGEETPKTEAIKKAREKGR